MTDRRSRGAALGTLLMALAVCCVTLAARPADDEEEPGRKVGDARTALQSWVENRRMIAREKRDWALGKALLEERIEIVREEIRSLKARIEEDKREIADADTQRVELIEQNERLEQASASMVAIVEALEARTQALLVRVPEPLVERVKPLSQRFPDDPKDTRLSLSERFANVVGVLNAMNKFHREITVTSEVRTLPDGTTAEVAAVYLGIAQAYYAAANGAAAGVGTGTDTGWVWTAADEHADAILEAIAVLENETPPAFVPLPLEIR